ncbi:bifunctional hydroxymethylpyrimidine kinase/phosphomethylpyrimidine kinase [Metabacillus iocasae]|uniref:Hydroxymethylpyrimidine/phosphomethylpyrimidine kinase n=1 Tax=Priestia iocasae TaxID=2291674 RepID=A0ABS2QRY5_9BACI|nr:bifunctional hydroxymethylpyrimidine kinase/phosphomethylpyrimidine kinase [Metabacillus iocasae]MBM7702216.1 hydroxymethylpyrimidine/phosphomethylpyrimidine kinase [Metabacillus iocasae]
MTTYKALTIAGSDSGGGAGIQADLKTFQELKAYGMSAITAVTAQNTLGVQDVYPMSVAAVEAQIDSIGADLGADAVKTGMLFSSEIIEAVANKIKQYKWERIVVDPVMIAKGGASLLQQQAVQALKDHLLPLAMVITPNIPEAEVLTDMSISNLDERMEAAKKLHKMGVQHVVIKGGHGEGEDLVDLLYDGQEFLYITSKRIHTKNTHGTGCTFAAALTAQLAKGSSVRQAVVVAKDFIQAAIEEDLKIGNGHGPTNHWAYHHRQKENA